jgi:hypothetical protein
MIMLPNASPLRRNAPATGGCLRGDVVKEHETPPPPTTIRVCDSITCEAQGAETLLATLKSRMNHSKVRVVSHDAERSKNGIFALDDARGWD